MSSCNSENNNNNNNNDDDDDDDDDELNYIRHIYPRLAKLLFR